MNLCLALTARPKCPEQTQASGTRLSGRFPRPYAAIYSRVVNPSALAFDSTRRDF